MWRKGCNLIQEFAGASATTTITREFVYTPPLLVGMLLGSASLPFIWMPQIFVTAMPTNEFVRMTDWTIVSSTGQRIKVNYYRGRAVTDPGIWR